MTYQHPGIQLVEIHCQNVEVYVGGTMNQGNLRRWCWLFKEGRTNVHDEEQSWHLVLVTDELKETIEANILENRKFTVSLPQEIFGQPESAK